MRRLLLTTSLCILAFCALGASALIVTYDDENTVYDEGVRLPYIQILSPEAVRIRWRLNDDRLAAGIAWRIAEGKTWTLADVQKKGIEQWADVTGLAPATSYEYAWYIECDSEPMPVPAEIAMARSATFETPPLAGTEAGVEFWVLGCSGHAGSSQESVRNAAVAAGASDADFMLFTGDNAYWKGTDEEYQRGLFAPYAPLMIGTPSFAVLGNHDAANSRGFTQTGPMFESFDAPTDAAFSAGIASGTEAYYSFTWGPVHVVMLDSETDEPGFQEAMADWLTSDLAAARSAAGIEWIIVGFHHPPYEWGDHSSDSADEHEMRSVRERLVPIFDAGGVDLVLASHQHCYARSHLLRGFTGASDELQEEMIVQRARPISHEYKKPDGISDAGGTVYVTVGSASKLDGHGDLHPANALKLYTLGSLLVSIEGDRLEGRFVSDRGAVLDRFTIKKGKPTTR